MFALLNPCTRRGISMLRVARILRKQIARKVGALPAMHISLILAAYCNRTFSMKRMPVCFYAAATSTGFLKFTSCAVKPTSWINHTIPCLSSCILLFQPFYLTVFTWLNFTSNVNIFSILFRTRQQYVMFHATFSWFYEKNLKNQERQISTAGKRQYFLVIFSITTI